MEYANDAPENIEHVRDMLNEVRAAKEEEDDKVWEDIYRSSAEHCHIEEGKHGGVVNSENGVHGLDEESENAYREHAKFA